jgi:hypothetical protein
MQEHVKYYVRCVRVPEVGILVPYRADLPDSHNRRLLPGGLASKDHRSSIIDHRSPIINHQSSFNVDTESTSARSIQAGKRKRRVGQRVELWPFQKRSKDTIDCRGYVDPRKEYNTRPSIQGYKVVCMQLEETCPRERRTHHNAQTERDALVETCPTCAPFNCTKPPVRC